MTSPTWWSSPRRVLRTFRSRKYWSCPPIRPRRLSCTGGREMARAARARRTGAVAALALAALVPGSGRPAPPSDSGLRETTEVRLVQIEVSVSGPREQIERLRPEDFTLKIDGVPIRAISLDWDCPPTTAGATETASDAPAAATTVRNRPVSYLFYFDMPHLTMGG